MILIATIALVICSSLFLSMPEKLTEMSQILHHICLQSLPKALENQGSLEALVCGKNMQDIEQQQLLQQSSLIHIFIVSGSHFLILHKILARLLGRNFWTFWPLGIYALVTLCQPPSVRSLIFLVLLETSRRNKLFLSSIHLVFVSALLSLALFPQWLHSRSFLMSLMAALALAIASEVLVDSNTPRLTTHFLTQSFLYLIMGFCLWGLSSLHPLGILLNITLGPLIGVFLFPLALLIVVFPFLTPVFDNTLNVLFWILKKTSEVLSAQTSASPLAITSQWVLFLILISGAYYLSVRKRRRTYEN